MKNYKNILFNKFSLSNYDDGLREYTIDTYNGLNKCLEKLFQNNEFIHDKFLKINGNYVLNKIGNKIRPDYLCKELKLIVEFDGYHHYLDPYVIYKDNINTELLKDLGYNVIRIPFYIQLDNTANELNLPKNIIIPEMLYKYI